MKKYEIEVYITQNDKIPFQIWLNGLKDSTAQTKIYARLERARYGNFGNHKSIKGTNGLFEMRDRHGAGLRIYCSIIENKIVLLLAGSTKKDQKKVISNAIEYLKDYERNTNHD